MVCVWVHRRHESFPDVGTGFQTMSAATASALIRARCAQDARTDGRHLLPIDPDTVVRVSKPATRKTSARKTAAASQDPAPPPRRYKRRDMRPEDS